MLAEVDRLLAAARAGDVGIALARVEANPAAAQSIAKTFNEAEQRGFWHSRRNSTREALQSLLNEAAE